jgi:hypothetical protein
MASRIVGLFAVIKPVNRALQDKTDAQHGYELK